MASRTAQASPAKKPSFFRRLSLSTYQQPLVQSDTPPQLPVAQPTKHAPRSVSGPAPRRQSEIAGPAYEALPVRVTASRVHHDGSITDGEVLARGIKTMHVSNGSYAPAVRGSYGISDDHKASSRPADQGIQSRSPPQRQRIHPALASPPNSPPKDTAPSPYPRSQSTNTHSTMKPRDDDRRDQPAIQAKPIVHTPMSKTGSPAPVQATPNRPQYPGLQDSRAALNTVRSLELTSLAFQGMPKGAVRTPHPHPQTSPLDGLSPDSAVAPTSRPPISGPKIGPRKSSAKQQKRPPSTPLVSTPSGQVNHQGSDAQSLEAKPHSVTLIASGGESEASAYARAVSSTLAAKAGAPSTAPPPRRVSRPLPQPPRSTAPRTTSGSTIHVIASNDGTGRHRPSEAVALPVSPPTRSTVKQQLNITIPDGMSNNTGPFPAPVDPRTVGQRTYTNDRHEAADRTSLLEQPPRRDASSSDSARPIFPNGRAPSSTDFSRKSMPLPGKHVTGPDPVKRPPGVPLMIHVITQPRVQAALLPFLSINSFLSLMGSSHILRKEFTGETVGRWVVGEWGISIERERGRSWPNLTVWEGFLESLLHDPSSYSTYPTKWTNLLQHLCLSYTLVVLHLRTFPSQAFPQSFLPFEDTTTGAPLSALSAGDLTLRRPQSRVSSMAGSDAGSVAPGKMPRREHVVEVIMPEPLSAKPIGPSRSSPEPLTPKKSLRRGSITSIASASLSFGRRRNNSVDQRQHSPGSSPITPAAPMPSGKATLPPVSYPTPKRYGFSRHGELARGTRSRTSSESGRPGSVFSAASSPSMYRPRASSVYGSRFTTDRAANPVPGMPSGVGWHRESVASSDAGLSAGQSSSYSPSQWRWNSPSTSKRDLSLTVEPAFEKPSPYLPDRAPILRAFVPISEQVPRWPSPEGALFMMRELDKCGASKRLRLGDLIVNTAIRKPRTTEHVLIYVPFVRHLLVPLEYYLCNAGHLPSYIDAFLLPPSYYYSFLPPPQIIHLDLSPYAQQIRQSIRLAFDRSDVTVSSGAKLSAKRYLHVAGFEIGIIDKAAPEWRGLVSLEAEGTAEAKAEIERRLGRQVLSPWEVVREKSMMGTIWLRMVKWI